MTVTKQYKNNTERKTTVTKHIEKYLTTQFQTEAMNIDYTGLQNALSHALYLIEKCSLRRARITLGNSMQYSLLNNINDL